MKKLLLPAIILLTTACSHLPDGFTELARKDNGSRIDFYFGAPGFNSQDKAAWQRLHDTVDLTATAYPKASTLVIHFLDTTAYNIPPSGEMYSKPALKRVIAQYTRTPLGTPIFEADPFHTQKYQEPK